MRFLLDAEQRAFADSLDAMLTAADTPSVVRDWSRGDHGGGRALWSRIAKAGVFALAVPEAYEGMGPRPVELAVGFIELGRHAVPGPLVETVAAAALLAELADRLPAGRLLPSLASGEASATLALDGAYALDGDAATTRLALAADGLRLAPGHGPVRTSLDPARRLTPLSPGGELLPRPSASASHSSTGPSPTSSSAPSSASPSARSRRSGIASPTRRSPWSSRGRCCSARP
jgi:hypothetical protein